MAENKRDFYFEGYMSGYRDGIRNTLHSMEKKNEQEDFADLPISAMCISTRAKNCLRKAGCENITDVMELQEKKIAVMRGLGEKSAREIAIWLDEHGFVATAWHKCL